MLERISFDALSKLIPADQLTPSIEVMMSPAADIAINLSFKYLIDIQTADTGR